MIFSLIICEKDASFEKMCDFWKNLVIKILFKSNGKTGKYRISANIIENLIRALAFLIISLKFKNLKIIKKNNYKIIKK
jgi:hypothetical protein